MHNVAIDAIPDRATCIEMLREISDEAFALPHFRAAPELTVRYYSVYHWLLKRTPVPPHLAERCVNEPSIAATVGMDATETANFYSAHG
jgi:hypothetical protein